MTSRKTTIVGVLVSIAVFTAFIFIGYDLLFSKPEIQEGVILEKIFIPGTPGVGETPYGGVRRGKFFVVVHKDDQWIALVKTKSGENLQVHCLLEHYQTKNVGDQIHFKRYEGKLTHIEYFAHNEEY